MENTVRRMNNIAVSVFTVVVGFKMWLTAQGIALPIAFVIILIGIGALDSNITAILKKRRSKQLS